MDQPDSSAGASLCPLVPPLILAGAGVSLAMPAAQNAVLGAVAGNEVGKASGIFNMARFLGGTFGVAFVVAVFLATGSLHSASAFSNGFGAAMRVAGLLSLTAALVALALPAGVRREWRRPSHQPDSPGSVSLGRFRERSD